VKTKDQLKTKVIELVEELKDKGIFVKFTRLDDATENTSIESACKEKCLGIKFEFSGPRTP
jgi:phosphorylcholine metabolism protein LicD